MLTILESIQDLNFRLQLSAILAKIWKFSFFKSKVRWIFLELILFRNIKLGEQILLMARLLQVLIIFSKIELKFFQLSCTVLARNMKTIKVHFWEEPNLSLGYCCSSRIVYKYLEPVYHTEWQKKVRDQLPVYRLHRQ